MGVRGYELDPQESATAARTIGRSAPLSERRAVVFVNSMSDLFHPRVPYDFVTKVFVCHVRGRGAARAHLPGS